MKRLLFLVWLLVAAVSLASQSQTDLSTDLSKDWTDKQFRQYEDSVQKELYAPVFAHKTDSTYQKDKEGSDDEPPLKLPGSNVPSSLSIDKNLSVGQIVIKSGTSQTGARTYEVPIDVYPGMNGLTPTVSLTYNSQQGSSVVGTGWSVSGISMISRCGKSVYYDNAAEGVVMSTSDAFMLDGIRLIKIEPSSYILYESEYGNIKVKGYHYAGVIKYFEVFYPDGKKGVFGFPSNTVNQLYYPLTSLTDLNGNEISYSYSFADNLSGDYYSAPAVLVRDKTGTKLYHILRDYLGSITHIIDKEGTVVQELSYDAWGRLRDPETQTVYSGTANIELFLGRGYTGHEHLVPFGLINMNARLYDPVLGRFLSPDPFVQEPFMSQNFNRFSYALNNPLCYVDEDGEFFWAVVGIAAFVGAVTNVIANWEDISSVSGWKSFWRGAGYALIGGVAGGASAAVGIGAAVGFGSALSVSAASLTAASTGIMRGAAIGIAEGTTQGFLMNTLNSLYNGENFGKSLENGLIGAATDGFFGMVSGGVTGAISAGLSGRNIWNGELPKKPVDIESILAPVSESGPYNGYYGFDRETKELKYVGITSRDPEIRFKEHLRSHTNKSDLLFREIRLDLCRMGARIWEQRQISKYGMEKFGGKLYNLRNEIDSKFWGKYGIYDNEL